MVTTVKHRGTHHRLLQGDVDERNTKSISSKAASGLYKYTLSYRNVEKFDPGCSPIVKLGHHTTSRLIGVGHTNLPSGRHLTGRGVLV